MDSGSLCHHGGPLSTLGYSMGLPRSLKNLMSKPAVAEALPPVVIVEGVESTWSYHLAPPKGATRAIDWRALCGRDRLMQTSIPLTAWGHRVGHLPEKYCAKCEAAARAQGVELPQG